MYRDTLSINTQTKPRKTKQVDPAPSYEFIMFYNGECPFCQKEIAWLQSLNRQGRLGLYDIHGIYPDGRMVTGVEVFYAAYHAVRLGWLRAPTRLPVLRSVFTYGYAFFARHRLQWGRYLGRHCTTGNCSVK